jgi:recombination protein RecT
VNTTPPKRPQTSGQTVTDAVATRPEPAGAAPARAEAAAPPSIFDMVRRAKGEFASVLPSHVKPDVFTRVAVGALKRNEELQKAAIRDGASLMHALMEAARLGLEPGTDEYWLTPKGGRVLGIVGYQGEIELIYRAGAVSAVKAEIVCENDVFRYHPGTDQFPHHEVDWFSDRGAPRTAYAYAVMLNGSISKPVVLDQARIKRAMEASATAGKSHSPWTTDYGPMLLKTAVHDLAKWVPTSAEYRREQLRAVADVQAEQLRERPARPPRFVDDETGEVLDGEVLDGDVADDGGAA